MIVNVHHSSGRTSGCRINVTKQIRTHVQPVSTGAQAEHEGRSFSEFTHEYFAGLHKTITARWDNVVVNRSTSRASHARDLLGQWIKNGAIDTQGICQLDPPMDGGANSAEVKQ